MKKEVLKSKGYRLADRHIDHLERKAKKNGCPSDVVRDLIDADIEKEKENQNGK